MCEEHKSRIGQALYFDCSVCGGSKLMYRSYMEETGNIDGVTKKDDKVEVHYGKVVEQKERKIEYFCGSCGAITPSIKEMITNKMLF